jgi:hypothetical protein
MDAYTHDGMGTVYGPEGWSALAGDALDGSILCTRMNLAHTHGQFAGMDRVSAQIDKAFGRGPVLHDKGTDRLLTDLGVCGCKAHGAACEVEFKPEPFGESDGPMVGGVA